METKEIPAAAPEPAQPAPEAPQDQNDSRRGSSLSSGKRFAIGTNVVLQIFLAMFLVIMANYIAFKRPPKRWDISRDTRFQLSPMTKNLVANLQKPVKVIVFSIGSPISSDLASLLREYEYAAPNKRFETEYV